MKKIVLVLLGLLLISFPIQAQSKTIQMADAGWDSIKFHNSLAGEIIKELHGLDYQEVPGSSTILLEGLHQNEIDIYMEMWTDNLASYDDDLAQGKFVELGNNFDDNDQGFYVPQYVIDENPELTTVADLVDYAHLFPDEDNPDRARIYGAIPGWEVDDIMHNKYLHYNLDEQFEYFRPGSDAALSAALINAYDKKEPIVAYYWEPTWLMGMYDFVKLEDAPYNPETYMNGETELPPVRVSIGVSNEFYQAYPEVAEFLMKYETSSDMTSQALAHIQETGASYQETAQWFIQENDHLLDEWLTADQAAQIRESWSQEADETTAIFPFHIPINFEAIDGAVRGFSSAYSGFFGGIRNFLSHFVGVINNVLNLIPWYITLALIFLAGWKGTNKIHSGLLYAFLLFLVGAVGYWALMNQTLAIVIASVILSLIIGFPLGLLISSSPKAHAIVRPILDTMQTMPVFVYLIPALLFFGLGTPPAVIATTIYAIVPMVRLTAHGIAQIDKEVLEAAKAFGSTKTQALFKVQIPQALPTIMTGLNQTIMMAMSMVVTTSMIGAAGLGMEVLISVNRVEIGRGLLSGSAIVIMAVVLDRLTQSLAKQEREDIDE